MTDQPRPIWFRRSDMTPTQYAREVQRIKREGMPVVAQIAAQMQFIDGRPVATCPIFQIDPANQPAFGDLMRVMASDAAAGGHIDFEWHYYYLHPPTGLLALLMTFTRPVQDRFLIYFVLPDQFLQVAEIVRCDGRLALCVSIDLAITMQTTYETLRDVLVRSGQGPRVGLS